MKKLLTGIILTLLITAGCSSTESHITLDKKHTPFPDYVLASQPIVQETYAMAAQYPDVLKNVPCYCGCAVDEGHTSNLNCFVDEMGPNKNVVTWDKMGIS
jgi:hypothetical protein